MLLRAHGLKYKEIATRLGLARNTVLTYVCDPDGSKRQAFLESQKVLCPVCEKNLMAKESTKCRSCSLESQRSKPRKFTAEDVLEAIKRYNREFGRPPQSRDMIDVSGRGIGYPHPQHMVDHFGSWANAIEKAGFPRPRHGGSRPHSRTGG